MHFLSWMTLCGGLLLVMALSSAFLRRAPISTAMVYLGVGVALGPVGANVLRIDLRHATEWFERLTEVAVIVSLFIGGLKLRAPVTSPAWRAAFLLAGPVMLISIVGVALVAHLALGIGTAAALLLGAILAPTDPVLAGVVAVSNASDRDRMRYGLSGEAGLNDGMAFPFVVFALLWAQHDGGGGGWIAGWAVHRLLWAIPAALALGFVAGFGLGRVAMLLRARHQDLTAPNDFLALAIIALSYAAADLVGAWGFLAAFAAGFGLRRAELKMVTESPNPRAPQPIEPPEDPAEAGQHPPAEELVLANPAGRGFEEPAVAAGVLVAETLSFGDTAERLMEVTLIILVGAALADHWDVRAVPIALALFFVIRPLAVWLFLTGSPTTHPQRWLMGWFGIRGIGSLYYLAYALRKGGEHPQAAEIAGIAVSVVALSILIHGVTARPLLRRYEQSLVRQGPVQQ